MRFSPYPDGILPGKLLPVIVPSIYRNYQANLPDRMAWLTPDSAVALEALMAALKAAGGRLYLSDCFRGEMDQARARFDYLTGHGRLVERATLIRRYPGLKGYDACNGGKGKRAFSPEPGGSLHEAGRAIDVDMDPARLGMDQRRFAVIAHDCGWRDIVHDNFGDPNKVDVTEEWHWEYPGEFRSVYDQALFESGDRRKAYREMTGAAIADIKVTTGGPA